MMLEIGMKIFPSGMRVPGLSGKGFQRNLNLGSDTPKALTG
jgi:hypothetical protein